MSENASNETQQVDVLGQEAPMLSAQIPIVYFNSFSNVVSNADITSILMYHGQPVIKLSMSFTTAKTFAALLGEAIAQVEAATGQSILRTDEFDSAYTRAIAKRAAEERPALKSEEK